MCGICTSLENKPTEKEFDKSVKQDSGSKTKARGSEHVDTDPKLTPQQPPLTLGTAIPQNSDAPPPPPPMPTTQSPPVTLDTQPNPSVSVPPPPPPPLPQDAAPKKAGEPENDNNHYGDWMAELSKRLKSRRKGISGEQEDDVQQSNDLLGEALNKMSAMIPPPRSSSSSVLSDSGNVSDDEDWDTDPEPIEQASSGSQSLHRERSESPNSDYGSDDNVKSEPTPPSYSMPKAEKPPISFKPVNSKTKPEAPPATTVTEVKNSFTRSVKGLTEMFNNLGGSPVFSS